MVIVNINDINKGAWEQLLASSPVSTWFQSPEAYGFFASLPELLSPFVVAITRDNGSESCRIVQDGSELLNPQQNNNPKPRSTERAMHSKHEAVLSTEQPAPEASTGSSEDDRLTSASGAYTSSESCVNGTSANTLVGLVTGYVTKERSALRQYFTRRAIIYGGPLLAEDISAEELSALLNHLTPQAPSPMGEGDTSLPLGESRREVPIFLEIRNFNDYSRWRSVFEENGFSYKPHLNFHTDTSSLEVVNKNLGKNRKRDIRVSLRDGATIVEQPTEAQVREYYQILQNLYLTKVRTPLFPVEFFLKLYRMPSSRFLLVEYEGRIIGGTVCVVLDGRTVYEWFVCGEDGKYKNIFPSELATYAGLKYASEHDCSRFDMMGAGTPDEHYGVRDFKARFGGELVEHGRFLRINSPLLYKIGTLGVWLMKRIKK